jgi:hypothetical protein
LPRKFLFYEFRGESALVNCGARDGQAPLRDRGVRATARLRGDTIRSRQFLFGEFAEGFFSAKFEANFFLTKLMGEFFLAYCRANSFLTNSGANLLW